MALQSNTDKIMKSLTVSLFCFLFLSSCKTKNPVTETPVSSNTQVSNTAFFNTINQPLTFDYLKINGKIEITSDNYIPTLSSTLYIENEKKIWVNLSALFLNIARGMATPQGIKAYEKWNQTYIDSDFSYLNNLLGVNFINYTTFQNLLLGRSMFPIDENEFLLTENAQGYTLTSAKDLVFNNNGKNSAYSLVFNYSKEIQLSSVYIKEKGQNRELEILYSHWITVGNLSLPKNVKINIKGNKESQILIENTNFAFTAMETPYTVPSNYTKKELE